MVFYLTNNEYMLNTINSFCNITNSRKINISKIKHFSTNKSNVFFIPVYGEEELNNEWEFFLKKYAKNSHNIGIDTFFYLYGVYDLEIDKNTTIIKQIHHILRFLSTQINIFPLKIMPKYTPIESLVYYYNHQSNKKTNNNFLINKLIFLSNHELLQNNLQTIDFTSKIDGYSSVIDIVNYKKKRKFLTQVISSLTCESVILNRVKNINMNGILKKVKNDKILKLQLKSNRLKKSKSFLDFSSLEVLNLTANFYDRFNIDKLPKTIKILNISKNRIKKVKIKKTKAKVKKLILFNNKIVNMKFLSNFPNLEYLNIGLNPIEQFPDSILNLFSLKHLNMSYISVNKIPEEIIKLKQLETIDITGSNINSDDILIKLQKNGVKIIS